MMLGGFKYLGTMRSKRKKFMLAMAAVLLLIQFIQPDRSTPASDPVNDMLEVTKAPGDIRQLVVGACYDCHSYRTTYPWYGYVTPMSFIVQQHINEGREHLNFSLWDRYAASEEAGEAGEELQEGEMPPGYYRLMHAHARLSDAEKQQLATWFNTHGRGRGEERDGGVPAREDDEHAH